MRCAIFVDAGYLFAASGFILNDHNKIPRSRLRLVSPENTIASLNEKAAKITGKEILRVYWYDAPAGSTPASEQNTIAFLPGLKMRLGTLNGAGVQKGVDSLIVTDLIELARNRSITDALVLGGDADIGVAVTVAQSYGVRVHLLGVEPIDKNLSRGLRMEADSVSQLDFDWVKTHMRIERAPVAATVETTPEPVVAPEIVVVKLKPAPAPVASPAKTEGCETHISIEKAAEQAAKSILVGVQRDEIESLDNHFGNSKTVPSQYDRFLIGKTSGFMERKLTPAEMRIMRSVFISSVRDMQLSLA